MKIENTMSEKNPLGYLPITKLLLKFSVPSVIAMIVNSIYNIVDQIFIQRSGDGSLGNQATTVAFPLITFTLALSLLIGNGGCSLASLKMGENDKKAANKILGNSFFLIVISELLLVILALIFFEPLLKVLGASTEVMPYAKSYIRIILIGTVFMGIGSGLSGFIRADGAPNVSMFGLVAGCLLNIVLDPLFIYGFDMGVAGAAWGTIISQLVTAAITMWYLLLKGKDIRLTLKNIELDVRLMLKSCALGTSSFVTQFANSIVQICMNNLLLYYGNQTSVGGNTAMTAMGIVLKVNALLIGICVGIGTGAQPILGYNMGAGCYRRVRETFVKSVIVSTAIATVGWLIITFFPDVLLSIFGNNDPAMIEFACKTMRIFLGLVFVAGFNIVTGNYFQATGHAAAALVMSLSRQIIALLPLLFILPLFFGLNGILYAGFYADAIALVIGVVLAFKEFKALNIKIKQEEMQNA